MKLSYEHLGIRSESRVIVAVSGGADSVALLNLLIQEGFSNLVVAHVDHQLRSESGDDARFVQELAKKYGVGFELKQVDIRKIAADSKENVEAVGRAERYTFFEELRVKHGAKCVVTAHHADDQLETVLLNMVRGCGIDGLAGMRELEGHLWRPLLKFSKEEILEYSRLLEYRTDSTNNNLNYRRNFLRHEVIPKLKELNPNLLGTVQGNLQVLQKTSDYIAQEGMRCLADLKISTNRYDLSKFFQIPDFLQAVVLRELFQETHGHRNNLGQDHLDQLLKVLRTNASGKQKEFGPGKILMRNRDSFEIQSYA